MTGNQTADPAEGEGHGASVTSATSAETEPAFASSNGETAATGTHAPTSNDAAPGNVPPGDTPQGPHAADQGHAAQASDTASPAATASTTPVVADDFAMAPAAATPAADDAVTAPAHVAFPTASAAQTSTASTDTAGAAQAEPLSSAPATPVAAAPAATPASAPAPDVLSSLTAHAAANGDTANAHEMSGRTTAVAGGTAHLDAVEATSGAARDAVERVAAPTRPADAAPAAVSSSFPDAPVQAAPANPAEAPSVPVGAGASETAAIVPTAPPAAPAVAPIVPAESFEPMLEAAGLVWVNTDEGKLREAADAAAQLPAPARAPRLRKLRQQNADAPLVQIETQKP